MQPTLKKAYQEEYVFALNDHKSAKTLLKTRYPFNNKIK